MTADKSTANFNFFIFFQNWCNWGIAAKSEQLFTLSSGSRNKLGELGLRLRERTIVRNPEKQQARASLGQLVNLGIGRTIVQNPTSCVTCWTPNPEQLFTLGSRWRPGCPETEQLFGLGSRLNQAGQEPEKRTMTVFCGFGGSPKPEGTRHTARTRGLGNPEPDCPRHPRKCFLLLYGFYATMFYRIWVVMGSVRYFHAFMGKFLKFL